MQDDIIKIIADAIASANQTQKHVDPSVTYDDHYVGSDQAPVQAKAIIDALAAQGFRIVKDAAHAQRP